MLDLLFLTVIVAFFALMVLFVRLCERIVGPDEGLGLDVAGPDRVGDVEDGPEGARA